MNRSYDLLCNALKVGEIQRKVQLLEIHFIQVQFTGLSDYLRLSYLKFKSNSKFENPGLF